MGNLKRKQREIDAPGRCLSNAVENDHLGAARHGVVERGLARRADDDHRLPEKAPSADESFVANAGQLVIGTNDSRLPRGCTKSVPDESDVRAGRSGELRAEER